MPHTPAERRLIHFLYKLLLGLIGGYAYFELARLIFRAGRVDQSSFFWRVNYGYQVEMAFVLVGAGIFLWLLVKHQ